MDFGTRKLVCFGGGTGLSSLLSGLKHNPWFDISAVVNMFDNGGSSGELRDRFGILPPGDIMKCVLALAEDEMAARKILLKRIEHKDKPGHTGGNALLMALQAVYGDLPSAVDALAQILSVKGNVIPVTLDQAALCCRYEDGTQAVGEVNVDDGIRDGHRLASLFLNPQAKAWRGAVQAVAEAQAICIGPGSLYTSILPNFAVTGIREAVSASKAPVVFICNLFTEGRGMGDHTASRTVGKVEEAIGRKVDHVIVNSAIPGGAALDTYAAEGKVPILPQDDILTDPRLTAGALWTDATLGRHDPARLANLIFAVLSSGRADL